LSSAEFVDEVVTVDYNARGVVKHLYGEARKKLKTPLCLRAATALKSCKKVLVATGFRISRFGGLPETDGLLSTSMLASTLENLGGCEVAVLTDKVCEDVLSAGLKEAGARQTKVYGLQTRYDEKTFDMVNDLAPDLLVAVERPSVNMFGVYHNMMGEDISAYHAPIDRLLEEIRKSGVPLLAFGDGGNEVGMGLVKDAVEKYVSYGAKCRCGCGGGIAAKTEADVLVVSSTSDLGVFGALALSGREYIETVSHKVREVLKALLEAGAVDAWRGPRFPGVDGLHIDALSSVIQMLKSAALMLNSY